MLDKVVDDIDIGQFVKTPPKLISVNDVGYVISVKSFWWRCQHDLSPTSKTITRLWLTFLANIDFISVGNGLTSSFILEG